MTILPQRRENQGIGAAVHFKNVGKHYGSFKAVQDFSLEIEAGEFVSILGPSGSGKTTTLMMLAGFEKPSHGAIHINGEDVTALPPHQRNIGTVYQNYALFPHLTVAQNIAFPLKMRQIKKSEINDRVEEALALVRLDSFGDRFPAQLSGGQQQRVAIARALVFKPPLVLMDEPLGALDKKLREELQSEIKRIQAVTGSTIIYVTHDQDEALRMSDRVVVMNAAKIADVGSPDVVYDHPSTRFVASFLGTANFFEGRVDSQRNLVLPSGQHLPLVHTNAEAGSEVVVAVRPERIQIVTAATVAGAILLPAIITNVAYHGHSHLLEIRLESGENIVINQQSTRTKTTTVGSYILAQIDPCDLHVVES
ncbi:ABC transporter ATP-binding protein [Brucella sp. NBRC 12950]|uniref:ABC transporter ATP-binding protein n=1 Tax=Brucella sp. NBRC 12950 TaxID=2994518 RepID=UPI0025542033|nr:ABC transporter ATP-binding protein [Brucella sp. NBRC 12950]